MRKKRASLILLLLATFLFTHRPEKKKTRLVVTDSHLIEPDPWQDRYRRAHRSYDL